MPERPDPEFDDAALERACAEWMDECPHCGGTGYSDHDCGVTPCACQDPQENVVCDWCGGPG